MEVNKERRYTDKLRRRRHEIDLTLRHLENERRQVEANTEWANRVAYHKRLELLERLTGWYRQESSRVEAAIERVQKAGCKRCSACHEIIGAQQLAAAPETELCAACRALLEASN